MAKVLIDCETSGVVREAFLALGHDAWSCDLLPSDSQPSWPQHSTSQPTEPKHHP